MFHFKAGIFTFLVIGSAGYFFIWYKFPRRPKHLRILEKTSIYGHVRSKLCLKFLTFILWFTCTKSIYLSPVWYFSSAISLDIEEYILLFIYIHGKKLISHEEGEAQKLKATFGSKMPINWRLFKNAQNFWKPEKFNGDETLFSNTYQQKLKYMICFKRLYHMFQYMPL